MNGFILVDKPKGITSHDVVDKIRRKTGVRRVGHGGTLDPNASGLLIVGVGREYTKKLGGISKKMRKTYEAEIVLGSTTDTDDALGIITKKSQDDVSEKKVKQVVKTFVGRQMQTPPIFSAIKIKGKKAYELARQGKGVELMPREIEIYTIKFLSYKYPILKLKCEVSSGTYIRALARDIGEKLGTGAYLNNLVRTRIGKYKLEDAKNLWNFFTP